jgi:YVTN family beta-propeller protein
MLALPGWLSGCSLRDDEKAERREQSCARSVCVAGIELHPLPARVVDECRATQEEARVPVLCPTRLPRPSRSLAGDSALPPSSITAFPWGETGIDISYSAEAGRPKLDHPDRFLHLQVIEQDQRLPPGARPAKLGGKSGALAPATSRGYASEPYFGNHLRFFWTEDGVQYAATLHNFWPRTRALLDWLVAHLRPAEELQRPPDTASSERVRTIEVPVPAPVSVAVDEGRVWVAGQGDTVAAAAWLASIDTDSFQVTGDRIRIAGVGGASALAVGDSLYVAHRGAPSLYRLEPGPDELVPVAEPGDELVGVAAAKASVWALDFGGWPGDQDYRRGSAMRVDRSMKRVEAQIPVGRAPADIAIDGRGVWVTTNLDGTASRIDPITNRAVETVRVGGRPTGVAAGYGSVWVADHRNGTVSRIDPAKGEVVQTIPVGRAPRGVAVGEGSVWVTNELEDTVSRIDPQNNSVTETIQVGAGPVDVTVGAGAVWVANLHDATVSRIEP